MIPDFEIVTYYNAINYGAVLQAYALHKFLTDLGYNAAFKKSVTLNASVKKKNIKQQIIKLGTKSFQLLHYNDLKARRYSFNNFISKYLPVSDNDIANVILAGSDQIWNPLNYNPNFFLNFPIPANVVKASYAASIGVNHIPENMENIYRQNLKNFDYISVRENNAKIELQKFTSTPININIDPTFLLKKTDWEKLEKKPKKINYEKYILVYILHIPQNINLIIKWIKNETGLPIVLIDQRGWLNYIVKSDKVIRSSGPEEFLWLTNHAEIIITSSFHGTAFSLIFEKEFYSIVNTKAPSRISSLLDNLGLTPMSEDTNSFIRYKPDYSIIQPIIVKEKERSKEFIDTIQNKKQ